MPADGFVICHTKSFLNTGIRYFTCKPKHGLFVRPERLGYSGEGPAPPGVPKGSPRRKAAAAGAPRVASLSSASAARRVPGSAQRGKPLPKPRVKVSSSSKTAWSGSSSGYGQGGSYSVERSAASPKATPAARTAWGSSGYGNRGTARSSPVSTRKKKKKSKKTLAAETAAAAATEKNAEMEALAAEKDAEAAEREQGLQAEKALAERESALALAEKDFEMQERERAFAEREASLKAREKAALAQAASIREEAEREASAASEREEALRQKLLAKKIKERRSSRSPPSVTGSRSSPLSVGTSGSMSPDIFGSASPDIDNMDEEDSPVKMEVNRNIQGGAASPMSVAPGVEYAKSGGAGGADGAGGAGDGVNAGNGGDVIKPIGSSPERPKAEKRSSPKRTVLSAKGEEFEMKHGVLDDDADDIAADEATAAFVSSQSPVAASCKTTGAAPGPCWRALALGPGLAQSP